ncbi:MAG TPA: hypothetical protein VG755_09545 [Nannocystaceae bacterium]|nr:hypothetical protein [Nannocystaceae bacterium]
MYTVVDLGAGVEPTDIDAHGNVLAHRGPLGTPTLFPVAGAPIDIGAKLGLSLSSSYGMNDLLQVVASGNGGFVCDLAKNTVKAIPLDLPLALNDVGLAVGRVGGRPAYSLAGGPPLPIFSDDSGGSALAVNDSGTMVGVGFAGGLANQAAWSFHLGGMLKVHTVGSPSIATAINKSGMIAGVDDGAGFVIDANGQLTQITVAGLNTSVLDIADGGRFVGLVSNATTRRGFVGQGAAIQDLTALLVASPTVVIEMGVAINAAGWIAATGRVGGELHGLLLKPIAPGSRFRTLATIVHILIGGRLDDDGVGIGHGPEPLPPGPLRDGLVGMALVELAELLEDRGTRAGVRALARERMQVALEHVFAGAHTHAKSSELGSGFPPLSEL